MVYTGCVGDDDLAEQLKAANKREGLDQIYQVKKGERTGACAVIITGHDRFVVSFFLQVTIKFRLDLFQFPRHRSASCREVRPIVSLFSRSSFSNQSCQILLCRRLFPDPRPRLYPRAQRAGRKRGQGASMAYIIISSDL